MGSGRLVAVVLRIALAMVIGLVGSTPPSAAAPVVEDLGPMTYETPIKEGPLAPTPDGSGFVKLFYELQNVKTLPATPLTIVMVNLQTGQITRTQPTVSMFREIWTQIWGNDGKLYIGTNNPAHLLIWDPKTPSTIRDRGRVWAAYPKTACVYSMNIATDGAIVAGGCNDTPTLVYDPKTDALREFAPFPARGGGTWYAYSVAGDSRYVYAASGKLPWYTVANDRVTGQQAIVMSHPSNEYLDVMQTTLGAYSRIITTNPDGTKVYSYYALSGTTATKIDKIPAAPPRPSPIPAGPPEVLVNSSVTGIDGSITMWWRFPADKALAPKTPPPGATPAQMGWKTVTMKVPVNVQTTRRLARLPNGKLLGTTYPYGDAYIYDPATGQRQILAWPNSISNYSGEYGLDGKIYLSGYPSTPLIVYDPAKPWTEGINPVTPAPAFDSAASNPRRLQYFTNLMGTHYGFYMARDAQGRQYIGGHAERLQVGGGLGIYDPATGAMKGIAKPMFTNYDMNGLTATPDGKLIVYASKRITDPLTGYKPPISKLFVFDTATQQFTKEWTPFADADYYGPIVAGAKPSEVVGYFRSLTDTRFRIFCYDVVAGRVVYQMLSSPPTGYTYGNVSTFERGPDGMIWAHISGNLVRIDPATGLSTPVVAVTPAGDLEFVGQDVYMTGTTSLRRIRGVVPGGTPLPPPPVTNQPPVLAAIGSKTAIAGQRLTFTLSATDPDGGPSTLSYSGAGLPTGATLTGAVFDWQQTIAGTYSITFLVSDGQASDSETIVVTVTAATNKAPVVNAGVDQTITLPSTGSLSATVTDDGLPSGAAVTTTWSKVTGPGTVTFAAPAAKATTATFSLDGTYVLRLTASDSALSASDDVAITVQPKPVVPGTLTVEDLGPMAYRAYVQLGPLAPDPAGTGFVQTLFVHDDMTTNRAPMALVSVNLQTGEVVRTPKVTSAEGGFYIATASVWGKNGKLYLGTYGRAHLMEWDPKTPTQLKDFGETWPWMGSGSIMYRMAVGPDGAIYGAGITKQTPICRYDPSAPNPVVEDLGIIGLAEDTYRPAYIGSIAADARYVYVWRSRIPSRVMVFDRQTKIQQGLLRYENSDNPDIGLWRATDGSVYAKVWIRPMDGSPERREYYRLQGFQAIKVETTVPAGPAISPLPTGTKPEILFDPTVDANKTIRFWWRLAQDKKPVPNPLPAGATPEQYGWRSVRIPVGVSVATIAALARQPDGQLFGATKPYTDTFRFDPVQNRAQVLGPHATISMTNTMLAQNNLIYYSGYPSTPLHVYDPAKPYTLMRSPLNATPDITSPTSNPRRLLYCADLLNTHYGEHTAKDAGGRIYVAAHAERLRVGGGLCIYDPATGQAIGIGAPTLTNYDAWGLTATPDGKYIVYSSKLVTDPNNPTATPKEAQLFVYDPSQPGQFRWRWTPLPGRSNTGLLAPGAPGQVVGAAKHSSDTATTLYAIEVTTGRVVYQQELPGIPSWGFKRGPDGKIWTKIGPNLLRITPETGESIIVGTTKALALDFEFVGPDLYLAYTTLSRIRGVVPGGTPLPPPPVTNQPPVLTAIGAKTVAEGQRLSFALSATDANGQALTYSATGLPTGATLTGVTFDWAQAKPAGSYSVTFLVSDGQASDSETVAITVSAASANKAPIVNAGADQTVTLPSTASLSGTVTDDGLPAGKIVTTTWSKVTGPGTVTFAAPAAKATTATFSIDGTYVLRLTASDSILSASDDVQILVKPKANTPPVAKAGAVTTAEDTAIAITLAGTDAEGDALTYTITTRPVRGTLSGTAPGLTYAPAANANGADSLQFTVSDGTATSAPATIAITVTPVNDAPVAGDDAVSTAEDTAVYVSVLANDSDPDRDVQLGEELMTPPANGTVTAQDFGLFLYTPAANFAGTDRFTYRVTDGALSDTATVTITVTPVNDAPVAKATATTTSGVAPLSVQIDGAGSVDVEGLLSAYAWDFGDGTTASGPSASHTFTTAGTFTIRLTVTDADGATATTNMAVTVTQPTPVTQVWEAETAALTAPMAEAVDPLASGGEYLATSVLRAGAASWPIVVPVDGDYIMWARLRSPDYNSDSFVVSVDDQLGDIFDTAEKAWSPAWQWRRVVGRGGTSTPETLNPRVFRLTAGAHTVTFAGRDKDTALDRLILTNQQALIVSDAAYPPAAMPNQPPVVTVDGPTTITLPATATLVGTVTDDGRPAPPGVVTLQWTRVSGPGSVTFGDASARQTIASFSVAGTYVVRLTASDSVLTEQDDLQLVVQPKPNTPPVATAQAVTTAEDAPLTLQLQGQDADGDTLTFTITRAPANGQLSGASASRTYTPKANFDGQDSLEFTVSDGKATSTPATIRITVTPVNDAPTAKLSVTPTSGVAPLAVDVNGSASTDVEGPLSHAWDFGDGSTGTGPTASHTFTTPGTWTIRLTVTDAAGATATAAAAVSVAKPAPVTQAWEAETAALTAPMAKAVDSLASSGEYLVTPVLHTGLAQWTVTVPVQGDYVLWARLRSPDYNSDSFYVSLDGGVEDIFDTAEQAWSPAWQWRRVVGRAGTRTPETLDPRIFQLSAGSHTLTFRGRDKDTALDRLVLTNQLDAVISDATYPPAAAPNQAPVVSAGPDQTVTLPSSALLTGKVTDDGMPAGKPLSIRWTKVSGLGAVVFDSADAATTVARITIPGVYVLRLTGSDTLLATRDDMQLTVLAAPNAPPVAQNGTVTTLEDTAASLTLMGTDPDGDALRVTILTAPTHGTLTGIPPSLTYTPHTNYDGPDSLRFTVSDGTATSAPATVSILVTPVNDPPIAQMRVSPTSGSTPLTVSADATGSRDPEGPLNYAWNFGDGTTGAGSNTTHTYGVGEFTLTLTVTDTAGATATATERILSRDATPPQIRDLRVERTPSRELAVTWLTDEPATSTLTYWHEDDQIRRVVPGSATPITAHRLIADQPKRRAWFIVTVRDAAGNALSSPERRLADDNDLR